MPPEFKNPRPHPPPPQTGASGGPEGPPQTGASGGPGDDPPQTGASGGRSSTQRVAFTQRQLLQGSLSGMRAQAPSAPREQFDRQTAAYEQLTSQLNHQDAHEAGAMLGRALSAHMANQVRAAIEGWFK